MTYDPGPIFLVLLLFWFPGLEGNWNEGFRLWNESSHRMFPYLCPAAAPYFLSSLNLFLSGVVSMRGARIGSDIGILGPRITVLFG